MSITPEERKLISQLLNSATSYDSRLLRLILVLAVASGLMLDIVLVVTLRPDFSWLVLPAALCDGFLWMLAFDFLADARHARAWEDERQRLTLEMRANLNELSAERLRQALDLNQSDGATGESEIAGSQSASEISAGETVTRPPETGEISPASPKRYGTSLRLEDLPAEQSTTEEPATSGISQNYPDPIAQWGLVRVREFYQRMEKAFLSGENSTYSFIFGVVTGKAISETDWTKRGLSKRTHASLMELLEAAGVVTKARQGQPRRALIKNPVQAWLVASEEHNRQSAGSE